MDYSLTVRGPRLIREIGHSRTDSGLSMDTAASRLDWSKSKLYRIEAGPTRDSKNPDAGRHTFAADDWQRFTGEVKQGTHQV
jgi:Domain of unknown function (DUF397)